MCGRYYLDEEIKSDQLADHMKRAIQVASKICADMKTSGDIRPTDIAPVIAPSRITRSASAFPMKWGFNHPRKGMLVFNTRMETATEKDLFISSVDDRRCLIPASCYFEWKKIDRNKKERYAFYASNQEPLYLAGLYIRTSDEHRMPCFTVLTQDAEQNIKEIHPRMPVLVPYSRAEEWLSPDTDFYDFIYNLYVPLEPRKAE